MPIKQAAADLLHSSRLNRRPPVIATDRRPPQQRTAGHSSGLQVRENPQLKPGEFFRMIRRKDIWLTKADKKHQSRDRKRIPVSGRLCFCLFLTVSDALNQGKTCFSQKKRLPLCANSPAVRF